MALSPDLISQFAKLTNNETKKNNETVVRGTFKTIDGEDYVQIDGSEIWTPVTSTVEAETGERVTVLIKDHTATVTGNITSPTARTKTVDNLKDTVDEYGNTIKQLDNTITQQNNSIIQINNTIKQQGDTINSYGNVIDSQNNKIQEFDNTIKQQGNTIESINNTVTEHGNQITSINNTVEQHGNTINQHDNTITQQGNTISQQGNIISQQGNTINQHGTNIETLNSNITILNSGFKIEDGVLTGLSEIVVNELETTTLNTKYANIDFSNINQAAIEKVFADSGIIKDLIMSDGKVTGELVGVTIKGDLIEGNTVKADKLVILGEDGLYYKLNVDALGETTASSDEKYQNGLDGSVIIAESITAEKISVDDLVAFGATIGGYHINEHSLYSGTKNSVDNTTRGVFLGDDGQIAVGDSNNYLKFFKDADGNYKLEIQASSLKFGTSGTTVEDAINDINNKAIVSSIDQFYVSTSSDELAGGSWEPTLSTDTEGKYVWQRTKVTKGDGTIEYQPSENGICVTGKNGNGISSITRYYLATDIEPPTYEIIEWDGEPYSENYDYLYKVSESTPTQEMLNGATVEMMGETFVLDNFTGDGKNIVAGSTTVQSFPVLVGVVTETNDEFPMSPGTYFFRYMGNYYISKLTMTIGGVTTDTEGWTTAVQSTDSINKYLWSYEVVEFTDGTTNTSEPAIIGTYGDTGDIGSGIDNITRYYLASDVGPPSGSKVIRWTDYYQVTMGNAYCKVSDDVFTPEELLGQTVEINMGDGTMETRVIDEIHEEEGYPYIAGMCGELGAVIVVTETTENWDFPTGTYFIFMDAAHVDSLTIESHKVNVIEWDGSGTYDRDNIEGMYYKVSDEVYTEDELVGAMVDVNIDGELATIAPIDYCTAFDEAGNIMAVNDNLGGPIVIVINTPSEDGSVSKGTYLLRAVIQDDIDYFTYYVTKLTMDYVGNTIDTEGWTTTMQPLTPINKYLWSYEVVTFDDGSTNTSDTIIVGVYGDTGDIGNGVSSILRYYLACTDDGRSDENFTIKWDGDTTDKESMTDAMAPYYKVSNTIFTREEIMGAAIEVTVENDRIDKVVVDSCLTMDVEENFICMPGLSENIPYVLVIGKTTTDLPYSTGTYFMNVPDDNPMYTSKLAKGVTIDTEGWTSTPQTTDPVNKYLWSYEVVIFDNGTSSTSLPTIIGTYGSEDEQLKKDVQDAISSIETLKGLISHLVTDANGASLMTQTPDGWTFNMSSITGNLEAIQEALKTTDANLKLTDDTLQKLSDLVDSVAKKTAYVTIETDANGDPCIILGRTDNLFRLRITNTAIDFLEGSARIAYANNNTFYSEKMITKELQIGEGPGYVWRTRANGNFGLTYIP